MRIKEAKKLLEEMRHVEWNDPACTAALDLALSLIDREALVCAGVESELVEEALPARDRLKTWERDKGYARRERVTPEERAEAIRQAKVMQLEVLEQRAAYLQKAMPQPNQVNADRRDHLAELDDLQELERVLIQADALDRELRPELYEAPTGAAFGKAGQT